MGTIFDVTVDDTVFKYTNVPLFVYFFPSSKMVLYLLSLNKPDKPPSLVCWF